MLINTFKSKNLINYTWSARNQFDYYYNNIKFIINYIIYIIFNLIINILNNIYIFIITLRSSETIRKTSLNNFIFNNFYNEFYNLKNLPISSTYKDKLRDKNWLIWFIGFVEGDGAILNYNNQLRFVLTQKESKILYEIKHTLNMGTIKSYVNKNNKNEYSRLIITNPEDIYLLTLLFNGNLVLNHRINQLNNWINILNNKYNKDIIFINKPQIITLNDSWISGFTDAEGCFNVLITKNNRYTLGYVIKLRFILDQNDELILNNIKLLFNNGKVTLRLNKINQYRYTLTGFKSLLIIRNYFNNFPLKTNKLNSFKKWDEIYSMILNKEHLTKNGLNKINYLRTKINLKNSLNKKIGKKII